MFHRKRLRLSIVLSGGKNEKYTLNDIQSFEMKFLFLLGAFFLCSSILAQADTLIADDVLTQEERSYRETMTNEVPLFGGVEYAGTANDTHRKISDSALIQWLANNVSYPKDARKNKTTGLVLVNFYVEIDGTMSEVRILKDIGDGCGDAVLEVLKNMPKWVSAYKWGGLYKTRYTLPVNFELGD